MTPNTLIQLSLLEALRLNTRNRITFVERLAQRGDYIQLPLGSYFFNAPDAALHVLQRADKYFQKQDTPYDLMFEALGPGALTLDGKAWKEARARYQPQFFHQAIEEVLPTIRSTIQGHCSKYSAQSFSLNDMIAPIITEVMLSVLCGVSSKEYAAITTPILQLANKEISRFSPFIRPISKRKKLQKGLSEMHQCLLSMAPKFSPQAMLGPLIEGFNQQSISEAAFLGELKNFLIAGAETTSSTLAWAFYNLTTHSDAYTKICHEIRHASPPDKWLGASLPYTQHCLEETMRLYPSIWTILRKSILTHQFGDIKIKKNQIIMLCPYTLHRHPDYWDNPLQFIPERFQNEHKQVRTKGCYIPFGLGKRTCIGQQLALGVMKVFLYELLSQFDIQLLTKSHPGITPFVTLQPKTPIVVKLLKFK